MRSEIAGEVVDDIERKIREQVERHLERVASCHERVACPTCLMPVGEQCRKASRRPRTPAAMSKLPLKHPHRARITADGISLR